MIPAGWLPKVNMQRIICHWTAGAYGANSTDKAHYHILIEGDGTLVRGNASIALNASPVRPGYAAHTLNTNGGSIGVSCCCMAGAVEFPFYAGKYPLREVQWKKLVEVVAGLCEAYNIPVTLKTVMTHAEVQANLGIKQRGKWNFTRLAFDPSIIGSRAIGDRLRREVNAAVHSATEHTSPVPTPVSDSVARPLGTVTVNNLNMREQPGMSGKIIDQANAGDKVEINKSVTIDGDEWLSIIMQDTRQWAWVAARYVARD